MAAGPRSCGEPSGSATDAPAARALTTPAASISGAEGLMLVVFHPGAGSSDAEKLALLASAELPALSGG